MIKEQKGEEESKAWGYRESSSNIQYGENIQEVKQTKCMSIPVEQYEKTEAIQWIGKKEKQYTESGKIEGTHMKRKEEEAIQWIEKKEKQYIESGKIEGIHMNRKEEAIQWIGKTEEHNESKRKKWTRES